MHLLPSPDEPYGALNFLHTYVLTHAEPITASNWPAVFVLPFLPLGVQTFLLQHEGTRLARMGVGALGVWLVVRGCALHRFVEPEYNAFNNGLGIAMLHISAKYVEYALTSKPIIDPYLGAGRRNRIVAAIDLAINSRMVGLGRTYVDPPSFEQRTSTADMSHKPDRLAKSNGEAVGRADGDDVKLDGNGHGNGNTDGTGYGNSHGNSELDADVDADADGGVSAPDGSLPRLSPDVAERWLPYPVTRRTRGQAVWRHLRNTIMHYTILDTLLVVLRHWDSETIGNPLGCADSLNKFLASHKFYLLPYTALRTYVPSVVVLLVTELCLAIGIWQGLLLGYHGFALIAVGSGLYEVEAWEVDFMDAPWKADSLLDVWGRRWHQLFRHTFLITSILILRALRQPPTSPWLLPLIFLLSGALHAFGQITMHPVPATIPLLAFFFASGVGCALEVGFKKLTGRRVQGWAGRLWVWIYMLTTARLACGSWFDSGLAGTNLTPVELPGHWATPGQLLLTPITWLMDAKTR